MQLCGTLVLSASRHRVREPQVEHSTNARYISNLDLVAPIDANSPANLGLAVPRVRYAMHRRGSVIATADSPQGGDAVYLFRPSCLTRARDAAAVGRY